MYFMSINDVIAHIVTNIKIMFVYLYSADKNMNINRLYSRFLKKFFL